MNINSKQAQFVAALLQSRSVKDAATAAGISERTAARWLNENPAVQAALRQTQDAALSQAARLAAGRAAGAISVLHAVMVGDDTGSMARIAAARELLRAALALSENVTTNERLAALEAAMLTGQTDT